MTVDVAKLGVQVDTRTVKSGKQDLDQLAVSGANAENKVVRLGNAAAVSGGKVAKANGHYRQTAMQFSQILQQGAATGNYLSAFSIQLADLALVLGPVGILAGAAGGALLQFAANAGDSVPETERWANALDALSNSARNFQDLAADEIGSINDRRVAYGLAADEALRLLEQRRALAGFQLEQDMSDAVEALTSNFGDMARISEQAFDDILHHNGRIQQRHREMTEAMAAGNYERAEALQAEVIAMGQLPQLVDEIARRYETSQTHAQNLLSSAREFQTAGNFEEQAAAASNLANALFEAHGGLERMSPETRELYDALTKAGLEAASLSATDLATPIGSGADEAERLMKNLGMSADLAHKIAQMNDINGNLVSGFGENDPRNPNGNRAIWDGGYSTSWQSRPGSGKSSGSSKSPTQTAAEREAKAILNATRTLQDYQAVLDELNHLHDTGKISTEKYTAAIDTLDERYKDVLDNTSLLGDHTEDLKESILDFAAEGVNSFGDLAQSIKRAAWELFLFGNQKNGGDWGGLLGGIFGGGGGGLFAGLFDSGGNIPSGKVGIAGEYGPELIRGPAHVTSRVDTARMMQGMGGTNGKVTVRVLVDGDGNIRAIAEDVAGPIAVDVVEMGIGEYDRALPDRMHQIQNDPTVR